MNTPETTPEAPKSPYERLENLIVALNKQMDTDVREVYRLAAAGAQYDGGEDDGFGFAGDLAEQLQNMKDRYEKALAKAIELGEEAVPPKDSQGELSLA